MFPVLKSPFPGLVSKAVRKQKKIKCSCNQRQDSESKIEMSTPSRSYYDSQTVENNN